MSVLLRLYFVFARIGLVSFGGGYAMVPLIEEEIVRSQQWLVAEEIVDILTISEMTPGPIAINLATFVGYRIDGILGSLIATLGVITPALVLVFIVAKFFFYFRDHPLMETILRGVRPVVIALIVTAAVLIARSGINDWSSIAIFLASFLAVAKLKLDPVMVIVISGVVGAIIY
ncbi:chromate transporter [Fuchsiella alkaliacetigena]|uniref:chromate transporter n=1 Tax=Fuchsiella alkaliacetigena TaxID=957042 RepID=UPI00200ADD16|nr:chromate transporter [Fuchsiella alkaliacetigena]MCK8825238.1 chromate transporter [Fuchsiella alkaliacetigena]